MGTSYKEKDAQELLEMGKDRLEITREGSEELREQSYEEFIIGKSTFAIITRNPQTGRPEHNIWAVMETIYDDYRKHPELGINKILEAVLDKTLSSEVHSTYLKNAIEELMYQLRSEKQGTAPFKLDCIRLLEHLRENIKTNKAELELRNMMGDLGNYNATLEEHYKQSIM